MRSKRVQNPRDRMTHFMSLLLLILGENFGIFLNLKKIYLLSLFFFFFFLKVVKLAKEIINWKSYFQSTATYSGGTTVSSKIAKQSILPLTSFNQFFLWSVFPTTALCYAILRFKILRASESWSQESLHLSAVLTSAGPHPTAAALHRRASCCRWAQCTSGQGEGDAGWCIYLIQI